MRGKGWNNQSKWKWVTLAVAAGMVIGQTTVAPVRAEELQEGGKEVGTEAAQSGLYREGAASISSNDGEEPGAAEGPEENGGTVSGNTGGTGENDAAELEAGDGLLAEDQMDIQTEALGADNAADNIASGTSGDITWVIDAGGKLTVEGTGDLSWLGLSWSSYCKHITSAVVNVSGMTDASGLFSGCSSLTSVDLSGFDTSNVTNMSYMFADCSSLTSVDLSGFDTSNVTNMSYMFADCYRLTTLDLSSFDTSKVIYMTGMFGGDGMCCSGLISLDLSSFDTSQVLNMQGMFGGINFGCSSLASLDLSNFDTSKVTDMSYMFADCASLTELDLSSFDTSRVTDMGSMFGCNNASCKNLISLNLSSFNTSKVTNMAEMFENCSSLTDLKLSSNFDTSQVTNMCRMFYMCLNLSDLDTSGFNTSKVTDMSNMFHGCRSLLDVDASSFDMSQVTNAEGMFDGCSSLKCGDFGENHGLHWVWDKENKTITISGDDEPNVHSVSGTMYLKVPDYNFVFNPEVEYIKFKDCVVRNEMGSFFANLHNLKKIDFDGLTVINLQSMASMFRNCYSLTDLDFSTFDTSKVTSMGSMFLNCRNLTSLDLSSFDTSNAGFEYNWKSPGLYSCYRLQTINSPKIMGDGAVDLPVIFIDPNGIETETLNKEFCNTTLYRKINVIPVKYTVVGTIGGRYVTFNTNTEDAVIYYSSKTSSLTTADTCVKPGETVLFENFYGTIYAKAYANGQWSNVSRLVLKIPVVNKPTITSKDGVVTIKTTTPDSYIYYTTDGSTPSPTNGTMLAKSGGSFTVPANCTVKAIAVRSCFTNSEVASASVAAKKLGAPSFVVKGVIGGREVTFNSTEAQGEIYYSFTTSNITTKDLHVKPGEKVLFQNYYGTVYAKTYVNGQWSNASRLILKIPVVNTPTITAAGAGKVKISTSTPNCAIYYTTDGSTPSPTNGTRINSSSSIVTVGSGKTVKAIAVRSCFTNSDVATYR